MYYNENDDGKIAVRVSSLVINGDGLAYADGVCIGRFERVGGEVFLEVKDRDKLRRERHGRDYVRIPLSLLVDVGKTKRIGAAVVREH